MALTFSQTFKNNILTGGSVKEAFDGSLLSIYSGPTPAYEYGEIYDPDGSNTLLITYSSNGVTDAGLIMADEPTTDGLLLKHPETTWVGTTIAEGTGAFFQIRRPDQYLVIMQGTCGLVGSGADLNLDSVTFALNTAYAINYFSLSI